MAGHWGAVVGVFVLAVAIAAFVVIPKRAWTIGDPISLQRPGEALSTLGSAAWSWHFLYGRASWPTVRIEADSLAIRIEPAKRWLSWYVPTATIPWVQASVWSSGSGITLRLNEKASGWLRVSSHEGSLVRELKRLGVHVSE
jgi:hypothetical protein